MFNEKMLNKMTKDELIRLVMDLQKDSLTGCYKREVMHNICMQSYTVAMVDVNGLKSINDTLGHDAGDEHIVSVVNSIREYIREEDIIIRYGGDEFVVVFKNCTPANAYKAMARVINASVGVGTGNTLEKAIHNADEAMYMNKRVHYSRM